MNVVDLLEKVIKRLRQENCLFAVAGGFAAMLYRDEVRLTNDVDIILSSPDDTEELAKTIIKDFKMTPQLIRLRNLSMTPMSHKKNSPLMIIAGASKNAALEPRLDFLLPTLPWVDNALERAQHNLLNYPFGKTPTITIEDTIIAKAYALANNSRREKDRLDILSIFRTENKVDLVYLSAELSRLKIAFPKDIESELPQALAVASKRIRNSKS
jgi:Nucleotidyl transferase AbiEii toxin, Type IV TA system